MNQIIRSGDSAKITLVLLSRRLSILATSGITLIVVACGGSGNDVVLSVATEQPDSDPVVAAETTPVPTNTSAPEPTPNPTADPTASPEPTSESEFSELLSDDAEKSRAQRLKTIWGWETNLAERTIPLTELEIGLPKDRIAPVDAPTFVPVADAPT